MKITLTLAFTKALLTFLIALGTASAAFAQGETATAQLSGVFNAGVYDYTITLQNTSTTPIGTFWYAWIPGEFFLPSTPASETPPTGWTASVVGSYSIEYTESSPSYALGGGASLNFYFTSTDTPAALAGPSPRRCLISGRNLLCLQWRRLFRCRLRIHRAIRSRTFLIEPADGRFSRSGICRSKETAEIGSCRLKPIRNLYWKGERNFPFASLFYCLLRPSPVSMSVALRLEPLSGTGRVSGILQTIKLLARGW